MMDFGVPYRDPIPMAEDNDTTRMIGHAGCLTRNVRHSIAIQTSELQSIISHRHMAMHRVDSANNHSDHFTKLLGPSAFEPHVQYMMGRRFITALHAKVLEERNRPKDPIPESPA
jgi:hypothetical protein